jgi:hypothetical protein
MAGTFSAVKVQGATLDYREDWSSWLGTDTIATATWTVSGATKASESNTTTTATARISGGTSGQLATAKCHITTAAGYEDERTIELSVVASLEAKVIQKAPGAITAVPAPTWSDLNGDTVASYSWSAAAGLSISGSSTAATVVITGGTAGVDYALTCTITTASGQIDARVITVQVRDR